MPGKYFLVFNVDGKVIKQEVDIMMDPRVTESGVTKNHLKEQVALSLKIIVLQSEAKKLSYEIEGKTKPLKEKLKKKSSKKNQSKLDTLERVYYQLETPEGIYMRPMLIAQLSYLYSMINRADQEPGKDAYTRFEELTRELSRIKTEYGKIK